MSKRTTHLDAVMAEQLELRHQANRLAASLRWWDIFLKTRPYKLLIETELKLMKTEQQVDYILRLSYDHIPGLNQAFAELIAPYGVLTEEQEKTKSIPSKIQ